MTLALIRAVRRGVPSFVQVQSALLDRECILGEQRNSLILLLTEMERMQKMDAYIAIRGSSNVLRIRIFHPKI